MDAYQIRVIYIINLLLRSFGSGNTGEYPVRGLCIVPPCTRANTASNFSGRAVQLTLHIPPHKTVASEVFQDAYEVKQLVGRMNFFLC